ncbi:lipid A deacylase LpxR family protein [Halospina sp. K52047b]|uniref:lipid A deacylase LpxR family protein n=1 Tax=Halospina sp. K52047b TaxID=2614160 RepID=UPI001CE48D19|nr:lipid A deacylase LpxR family protein [Halospina sp. K52047b]
MLTLTIRCHLGQVPRLLVLTAMLLAGPASGGTLSLSWDNDLLTGEDKGYTNGLRISYLEEAAENKPDCRLCLSGRTRDALTPLPGVGAPESNHALAWSLRQLMLTPQDIERREPQYDDIPYTGYLSGSVTLWSWDDRSITGYGVSAGVIGPDSMAEEAQEWVHGVTGSTNPRGWDNQLGTDWVGGVQALHARRALKTGQADGLQQDLNWLVSAEASNFISNAQIGAGWRFGTNLPDNFISDYAGLSSSVGMPGILDAPGPGWSVFVGVLGEWIPYSYLDERSGRYQYDQEPLVGHAGIGASLHTRDLHFSVSLRTTTSQDATNKEPLSFGTVSLVWRL